MALTSIRGRATNERALTLARQLALDYPRPINHLTREDEPHEGVELDRAPQKEESIGCYSRP